MKILCKLLICMVVLFSSCGGGERHIAMLDEIDSLCDSDPRAAMSRLDSIDCGSLSKKERHYYDLLSIKSRDKAYVRHTSDSLVLDVIDYYTAHKNDAHYPEALYYGGRVYSDIGDLPTALKYFQDAIDVIPEDQKNLRFKGNVLSQTGRLLEDIRLYSQATPYIEKSIEISKQLKDSADVFYDNMQLILLNINADSLNIARKYIHDNYNYVNYVDREDSVWLEAAKASVLLNEGNYEAALCAIRPLVNISDSLCKNYVLSIAANIYMASGIPDTTYMYAKELALSTNFNNKISGFNTLFSEEVYPMIPKDSLSYFVRDYGEQMNEYLNRYESEEALIQNTRYNYALHIREREEAEHKLRSLKENMLIGAGITVIILLIFMSIALWRKYHKSRKDSQIMEGIMLADKLKGEYTPLSELNQDMEKSKFASKYTDCSDAKKRILDEIQSYRENNPYESIDEKIKESSLYKDLKEKAENKRVMGNDVTWREIEELIESASAGFDHRLNILTKNQITSTERKVAHLIKCGFTQVQIASLLAKDPSTISAHRTSLAKKIGYDKSTIAVIITRL